MLETDANLLGLKAWQKRLRSVSDAVIDTAIIWAIGFTIATMWEAGKTLITKHSLIAFFTDPNMSVFRELFVLWLCGFICALLPFYFAQLFIKEQLISAESKILAEMLRMMEYPLAVHDRNLRHTQTTKRKKNTKA